MVKVMNEIKYEQLDLFDFQASENIDKPTLTSDDNRELLIAGLENYKRSESLYHNFRNTALSVYETYDWTDDELLQAAKDIYYFFGFRTNVQTSSNKVSKTLFVSEKKQRELGLFGKSDQTYCIPIYFKMERNEYYKRFLVLSDAKELVNHYTDTYYRTDKVFVRYTYLSKAFLLGFAYLIKAIEADFDKKDPGKLGFSRSEMYDLFKGLIAGPRSNNYNFYDYVMQHSIESEKSNESVAEAIELLKTELFTTGKAGDKGVEQIAPWTGSLGFKRLINYVQDFLDKNYEIVSHSTFTLLATPIK